MGHSVHWLSLDFVETSTVTTATAVQVALLMLFGMALLEKLSVTVVTNSSQVWLKSCFASVHAIFGIHTLTAWRNVQIESSLTCSPHTHIDSDQKHRKELLPFIPYAYNTVTFETTGYNSFFAFYARTPSRHFPCIVSRLLPRHDSLLVLLWTTHQLCWNELHTHNMIVRIFVRTLRSRN